MSQSTERFTALAKLHDDFASPREPEPAELQWRPFAGGSVQYRPDGVLGWALDRYEAGCDRETVLDGLSDHLLALRSLLEGGGPAGLGLPMRLAALCGKPEERLELRQMVERAQSLERRLMRGAVTDTADERLALDVACHVRSILAAATRGELGADLRSTADEILVADGVNAAAPVADMGETSEWEPPTFAGQVAVTDLRPDPTPQQPDPGSMEETQVMEIAVVTPIERAHEIRAGSSEVGWRREYNEISTRQHRKPRDFFPSPDTAEWSIGELQFNALRD